MKILFLGTGAADWQKDKKQTNSFFRKNSSVLIDGCILIDPGPHVIDAINEYNVDVKNIKYIINTHKHSDHFNEENLKYLIDNGADYIEFDKECEKQIGTYTVKSLKANHTIETMHYIISNGKSRMFYGLDGAWLMYDEVQAIKENPVDFAVFDATIGFIDGDYRVFEHNNLNMVIEMKKTLSSHIKRFCISHMARTLHDNHDALSKDMAKHGIEVAFDGMITEF